MSTHRLIVGIDLGTTHTAIAWATSPESGQSPPPVRVFPVPQLVTGTEVADCPLLPSFLYALAEGEQTGDLWGEPPWILGEHARRRGQEVPGRLVSSAKSWLCHGSVDRTAGILPWGADVAEEVPRLSPVEASARLLRHVRRAWDAAHPEAPLARQQVVLTVPASFDQVARELTLRAAADAGLAVRLLEEPQAAFYDLIGRVGIGGLAPLVNEAGEANILVCDVGGGTTDLTLIRLSRREDDFELTRVAVGRHLLLGGDNMDLALAHLCEPRLAGTERLDPVQFAQLTLACHVAKERLLGEDPCDAVKVSVAGRGSALFGAVRSTQLSREEAERTVLDGFFPPATRSTRPRGGRSGFVAFGLPYELDPAITRHVANFFTRHVPDGGGPTAVLLNGGVFRAPQVAARLVEVLESWGNDPVRVLPTDSPDLAVARGAVEYGMALAGAGRTIGGGAPHGYYVGIEANGGRRALCVVPRGAKEGERHLATRHPLALRVGQAVRFDLLASDDATVDAPGAVVSLDGDRFVALPPVTATFDESGDTEVRVHLEGELSAIGTLDLACVEEPGGRRFQLAFDLRGMKAPENDRAPSSPPSRRVGEARLDDAREFVARAFGKGRKDVKPREVKDLVRSLEKVLGERASWNIECTRLLFDELAAEHRARRRSPDHERVFWMLAGFCLRPGFGHPGDPRRIKSMVPLFAEGLTFTGEARGWQQYFIAWRRMAGGLLEKAQVPIRDRLDPFLAPEDQKLKKPKGFKPMAPEELLELASWLERVPVARRIELGRWLLERTWTSRDPRLWAALGRVGARTPTYASVHHVVPPGVVERWLDHLLREKWDEVSSAARTAAQLARVTGDRTRDVAPEVRRAVERQLVQVGAPDEWLRGVREFVPIVETERAQLYGEDLPVGLRLIVDE